MFNHRHITSSGIFVMVMVLVIGTDACGGGGGGGGRSSPSTPRPIPKSSAAPTQTSTENLKTCMLANISWQYIFLYGAVTSDITAIMLVYQDKKI